MLREGETAEQPGRCVFQWFNPKVWGGSSFGDLFVK
jgi:hypothetical protein